MTYDKQIRICNIAIAVIVAGCLICGAFVWYIHDAIAKMVGL